MDNIATLIEARTVEIMGRINDAFLRHQPALLDDLIALDCELKNTTPAPDGARHIPWQPVGLKPNRREVVGERGQMGAHSRPIVALFNEQARAYGPLSQRRSRFGLSPTGC